MSKVTDSNYLEKLFINEAKPALDRHSGGGGSGGGGDTETDLFPLQTIEGFAEENGYGPTLTDALELSEGATYYVEWDGTTYTCVGKAVAAAGVTYIGNAAMMGLEDTGEPFLIYTGLLEGVLQTDIIVTNGDTKTSHDIRIYQKAETVVIKSLTITENGTYTAPEGEAYTQVKAIVAGEGELFPLQTVSFVTGGDFYGSSLSIQGEILVDETYYVEWDGTEYTCTPPHTSSENVIILGSSSTPFTMQYIIAEGVLAVMTDDTASSHTIRIYQKAESGGAGDERVKYVTFMYGATELLKYPVIVGDTVKEPVSADLISTPTKEQTESTVYTFGGWSLADDGTVDGDALTNVTEDRTVYAAFTESARPYTVNFYDGETLMMTKQVGYGLKATPPDTFKDGYEFVGWTPSDLTVTGDTDFYGTWELDQGWLVSMELPSMNSAVLAHYSPDGTRFFCVDALNYYIRMYDATTQPYTLLSSVKTSTKAATSLDISPDGKWLAAGYCGSTSSSSSSLFVSLHVWRINEASLSNPYVVPSFTLYEANQIGDLVFSADSSKLLVGFGKYIYTLAIPETGGEWTCTATVTSSAHDIGSIDMSPDMTKVVTLGGGDTVQNIHVYDVTNNYADVTRTYLSVNDEGSGTTEYDYGDRIAYSPDGRYLACAYRGSATYNNRKKALKVYDTTTTPYTVVKTLEMTSSSSRFYMHGVAFSADGSLLALVREEGDDIGMDIYDTSTWELKEAPLVPVTGKRQTCAFSANNHLFLGSYNTGSSLYRVKQ